MTLGHGRAVVSASATGRRPVRRAAARRPAGRGAAAESAAPGAGRHPAGGAARQRTAAGCRPPSPRAVGWIGPPQDPGRLVAWIAAGPAAVPPARRGRRGTGHGPRRAGARRRPRPVGATRTRRLVGGPPEPTRTQTVSRGPTNTVHVPAAALAIAGPEELAGVGARSWPRVTGWSHSCRSCRSRRTRARSTQLEVARRGCGSAGQVGRLARRPPTGARRRGLVRPAAGGKDHPPVASATTRGITKTAARGVGVQTIALPDGRGRPILSVDLTILPPPAAVSHTRMVVARNLWRRCTARAHPSAGHGPMRRRRSPEPELRQHLAAEHVDELGLVAARRCGVDLVEAHVDVVLDLARCARPGPSSSGSGS